MAKKWEEAPIVEPEQRPAWEQAPITRASFPERAVGAVAKGEMAVGQAILRAPAMAVKQYGLVRQFDMANAVLRETDPERQAILREQMADSEQTFDKVANWLNKPAELHKIGRKIIEQNHPEWASDPPKNFIDLLISPDKLGIAVAESMPVLVNAGILTLAGHPNLAMGMMYVTEGQQAYDQAIQDGASEDDAAITYAIYGSVSAALEKMQLEGLLKIGKGSYNALLNRTVQKVAGRGLRHATWDVIKIAAQEGLEELSQGAWQEITAKLVYDKSVPDGVAGFIDRRAQEAYLGFMIGLIPGVAGGVAGAVKGKGRADVEPVAPIEAIPAPSGAVADRTPVEGVEIPPVTAEKPVERIETKPPIQPVLPEIKKEVEQYDALIEKIQEGDKRAIGRLNNLVQGFNRPTYDSLLEKVQEGDEHTLELIDVGFYQGGKPFGVLPKAEAPQITEVVGEEPEKLTGSAIRLKSGEMLTGTTHANILRDVAASGRIITNEEFDIPAGSGFVTDTGRFVSPQEGWDIAEKAGQLKLTGKDAMAQEFIDRKHLIAEGVDFAEVEGVTVKPKSPRMGRRKLLKLGHQLPKKLGWKEVQRRDFMQQTIGKPSMKGMTPKEMKTLVTALQGEAREAGVLPPEDYQKTMFIGTREVKTEEFFDKALAEVENLERKTKKKPKIITRRGPRRKRGLLKTAKAIGVGIDNLSIPHLIRKIGGAIEGVLKEVGVTNYRRSIHRISSVFRGATDMLTDALDKAGVTANDLAEMSLQLDPRLALIQRGRELVGKPKTKQYTVELNGKKFSLSMAELLDIYLSAQQEEGMGHIEKAGLKIFGEKTGPLTKEQLQPLLDLVRANPKAKAFANAVVKIATEYIAPQLNYTHSRINPEAIEKLADEINYWHLNVDRPLRVKGRGTYSISLLENKSILRPRKGPKGALIVGDAFSKFFTVQYAVAEYVGMAEELRLLNMVLNYEPIITELESKGYGDVRNNLKQLIEWVQDPKSSTVRADKLVSKILHGAYRAVLHFSPEVILSQYMSTGHYAGVVASKYVPLLSVPPTPKLIKEMLEHNPVVWMRNRAGGQSAELAETGQLDASLRLLTGKRADLNKTGIAAQMTDLAAFGQGWKVAKTFVEDTTQLKKDSPEYWDAVNDKAEELWDTQPSWDKWNKSINTSQRGIKRLPFLFRSYFEKSLMMLSTANETYKTSGKTVTDKAKWSQVYGAVIGSQMMTALIRTFIGHTLWRKRKSIWDYVGAMIAAPLVMVSVVGGFMNRVVGNVFRILAGEKQKFEGEPISNLATNTLEKFFLGIGQTTKAAAFYLAGEEDKAEVQIKAATRNLILSIGTMKGVPVRQIEKINKAVESEEVPKHIGGYID